MVITKLKKETVKCVAEEITVLLTQQSQHHALLELMVHHLTHFQKLTATPAKAVIATRLDLSDVLTVAKETTVLVVLSTLFPARLAHTVHLLVQCVATPALPEDTVMRKERLPAKLVLKATTAHPTAQSLFPAQLVPILGPMHQDAILARLVLTMMRLHLQNVSPALQVTTVDLTALNLLHVLRERLLLLGQVTRDIVDLSDLSQEIVQPECSRTI